MLRLRSRLRNRVTGLGLVPSFAVDFTTGIADSRITFTRASSGTRRNSSGVRETVGNDVPRFDYTAGGVALGLLIEEQRTNFFLNSGAPATQTIALTTGTFTLWMEGTGSIAVAAGTAVGSGFGTASNGSPVTFTVSTGGTVTCTVTGSPTIAQLENGAFATSYIPAAGAAATRAADVAVVPSLAGWFNASEGTILTAGRTFADNGASRTLVHIDDGTTNNRIMVNRNTGRIAAFTVSAGGVAQADITSGSAIADGASFKIASSFKQDDFSISANGAAVGTDTSGSIPTVTTMRIGHRPGTVNLFNGWFERIAFYPSRLPNTTDQAISA